VAKRSGLGKGLGALLGEDALGVLEDVAAEGTPSALREVDLNSVRPNPNQPRKDFDEGALQELADSVKRNGILQPIVVREAGDGFEIVAGERRWKAAGIAGLETVPVVVRSVSDDEILVLALVENLQRSDLNPIEAARGYRHLMEQGDLTQEALSQIVSKSRPAIANALRLLDLPDEIQDMVVAGKLSAGHARAILSVEGEESRRALAERVVAEGLSVRQTENLASVFSVTEEAPRPKRTPAPEAYKAAARRLRKDLNTKVSVKTVRGRNKIEIEFTDEDELEALVRRILGEKMGEEG
jgi:ParB family chromosome partitioning protein